MSAPKIDPFSHVKLLMDYATLLEELAEWDEGEHATSSSYRSSNWKKAADAKAKALSLGVLCESCFGHMGDVVEAGTGKVDWDGSGFKPACDDCLYAAREDDPDWWKENAK